MEYGCTFILKMNHGLREDRRISHFNETKRDLVDYIEITVLGLLQRESERERDETCGER